MFRPLILKSFLALLIFVTHISYSQTVVPVYDGPIPGGKEFKDNEAVEKDGITRIKRISKPTITIYKADKKNANGTAVLVCPGGGYWINAFDHEGIKVAEALNKMGITAFVLKYRIPNDSTMTNRETGALQDAQQALRWIRKNASTYQVDSSRVGILGFSAGGHLASSVGTHFETPVLPAGGSVRPDFMILIYPVISFVDSITHAGSKEQIVGKTPSRELIVKHSNEFRVTQRTPPTFLVHASDDRAVVPENSIRFYQALVKNGVKAELHLYQEGGHGFGLINPTTSDQWLDRCKNWMIANKLIPK